jgi:hypothetical protein
MRMNQLQPMSLSYQMPTNELHVFVKGLPPCLAVGSWTGETMTNAHEPAISDVAIVSDVK